MNSTVSADSLATSYAKIRTDGSRGQALSKLLSSFRVSYTLPTVIPQEDGTTLQAARMSDSFTVELFLLRSWVEFES